MLVGSVLINPNSSGGFRACAGPRIVTDNQRVNYTSFVFSAGVPRLLAVSASDGVNILHNTMSIFSTLAIHDGPKGPSFNLVRIRLVYVNSFISTSCYGVKIIKLSSTTCGQDPWTVLKVLHIYMHWPMHGSHCLWSSDAQGGQG